MDNVIRADALIQHTNKKGADIESWDEILPINLLVYDETSNIIKKGNGAYAFSALPIWLNLAELENLSNVGNYIEKNIFIDDNIDKLLIITKEGSIGITDVLTNTTLSMLLANISTILEIGGGVNVRPPIIIGKQRKNINTILELKAVSFTAYAGEKLIDYNWTLPDDSIVPGNTLNYIIPDDPGLLGTTLTFKCKAISHEFDFISKFSTHSVLIAADEDGVITEVIASCPNCPIINSIVWDPVGDHFENESYEMTIDATDPQGLDLTYEVVCDDGTVIIDSPGSNNIFNITYGAYSSDTSLIFTIMIANTAHDSTVETELITVHNAVVGGNRGIFGGGYPSTNNIEYITISTPGDVIDFGDLDYSSDGLAATSNGTGDRGVFAGGTGDMFYRSEIDYITISTPGDVTNFGDLSTGKYGLVATSNGTNDRGVFAGGEDEIVYLDVIEYINISAATGSVTDFGDLSTAKYGLSATSNGTNNRGIFAGGYDDSTIYYNTIEYINISAATGSVTDFGDLSTAKYGLSATSNGINDRGVFAGGHDGSIHIDVIEYINISAATGSVTDFGDLSTAKYGLSATSNGINDRGVFAGGHDSSSYIDTIEYINISAATGSVTDFGDLSASKDHLSATSDA